MENKINSIKDEDWEEIEKQKKRKFMKENAINKQIEENIQIEEDGKSPNYSESFRHHIVPFSQVIIKSSEMEPQKEEPMFPFLQPSRTNNNSGGDIELTVFEKDLNNNNIILNNNFNNNNHLLINDFKVKKEKTRIEQLLNEVEENPKINNTPKQKKKDKTILRIRRSFGMSTKESPYKFVFDDFVHHSVFYIPIAISAFVGLLFLIIAKLLGGLLIFDLIGIGILVFTPFWFIMMRTRTVKIDAYKKYVERRTTRCCVKSIDKFHLDQIKGATLRYYGSNHMIVLECANSTIIEVSLTADAFNHQLKEESVKQFNTWLKHILENK